MNGIVPNFKLLKNPVASKLYSPRKKNNTDRTYGQTRCITKVYSRIRTPTWTNRKDRKNSHSQIRGRVRLKFKTPELLLIAMSNTSVRNIFEDLNTHFNKDPNRPLQEAELIELASSGDASKVLALIGDAALDLAIVQVLWDSSLSTTGKLTEKRKEVASNKNLAKYCDQWGLFGYRLNRFRVIEPEVTKPETIIHDKGTLVEAILGVVYLDFDLKVLRGIVPLIQ